MANDNSGGMNLVLEPVEDLILAGFQKTFLDVFNVPTVWTMSSETTASVDRLFGRGKPVRYPYAVLRILSYTASKTRMHTHASSIRGMRAVPASDEFRSHRVHFLPIDFNVSVTFYTDSSKSVKTYANDWMFAARNGWLKFDIAYGISTFAVGAVLDENLNLPTLSRDANDVQEYVAESSVTIQGFISRSALREQQHKTNVQISTFVGSETPEALVHRETVKTQYDAIDSTPP